MKNVKKSSRTRPGIRKTLVVAALITLMVISAGFALPERLVIPVKGATQADWNHKSFWFYPWGRSGVHRGIDIFAREGTPVLSACSGIVVLAGSDPVGGNVVSVLGPKWRIHYYAHLNSSRVRFGNIVTKGEEIGTVGATGNAAGKPPHLHYSIVTQIPYVWRYETTRYGFARMFYLDPHERLLRKLK